MGIPSLYLGRQLLHLFFTPHRNPPLTHLHHEVVDRSRYPGRPGLKRVCLRVRGGRRCQAGIHQCRLRRCDLVDLQRHLHPERCRSPVVPRPHRRPHPPPPLEPPRPRLTLATDTARSPLATKSPPLVTAMPRGPSTTPRSQPTWRQLTQSTRRRNNSSQLY